MGTCLRSFWLACLALAVCVAPAWAGDAPAAGAAAVSVTVEGVENMYCVSPDLYRSGQPTAKGFAALGGMGVRSVLNLREYHRDNKKAAGQGLVLMCYPVAAGELTENDLEQCLRLLRLAPKPALVHCMHGSDRTGAVVAAYRIVEQGWSPEKAIAEMQEKRFGHHAFWYPNIPRLLRAIDWTALSARLDSPAPGGN